MATENGKIEIPDNFQEQRREVEYISARTPNQKEYIKAIINNDLVFAIGVAGSGKTAISVGVACELLYKEKIEKIVVTRPALEVLGTSIGFLPGSLDEKMAYYLQPLLESLHKFVSAPKLKRWITEGKIVTTSIGFMRGMTYENSIVIIDEAQNLTLDQMRMVITRLGQGSKMIFTGDLSQSDLPIAVRGALELYSEKLADVEGVATVHLTEVDIQRHRLVGEVLRIMKDLTTNDLERFRPRKLEEFMTRKVYGVSNYVE